jgi:ribosomal protein L23
MIRSRHTLLYLGLLLLVAGYFYYFEVIKKQEKEAIQKAEKKVFHLQVDQVEAFDILAREKPPLRVAKDQQWKIIEPVKADVDQSALDGFLTTLKDLEMERPVTESVTDPKIYGLDAPLLQIRFKTGDAWQEIQLGDKNPVGDGYYARIADGASVFLITLGNYTVLNKDLNELRRHQLFTFEPQSVTELEVIWEGGDRLIVQKQDDHSWMSPEHPETVIKKSKVDHVLDQIQWLRAKDFIRDDSTGLGEYGLDPAHVTVKLRLQGDREALLRLGREQPDKKRVNGVSSELAGVVQVDANLLQDLPKTLRDLENRALLGFDSNQVKQIYWRLAEDQGHLLQAADNQWVFESMDGTRKELKESWRVRSLFWELDDAQYQEKLSSAGDPPTQPHGYVEFWDNEKKLASLSWAKLEQDGSQGTTVWRTSNSEDRPQAVLLNAEVLRKIEEKLKNLTAPGNAAKPKDQ